MAGLSQAEMLPGPSALAHLGEGASKRKYNSAQALLMVRDFDSFTRYVRLDMPDTPSTVAGRAIPEESEAMTNAKQWLGRLGLPPDETGPTESHGIAAGGTTTVGAVAPVVVGRLVEFSRIINGIRVGDSFARFEFGPDGELRSALIHWPRFTLRPGLTQVLDAAVIQGQVQTWAAGRDLTQLHLVYLQDTNGYMIPGIVATADRNASKVFPVAE